MAGMVTSVRYFFGGDFPPALFARGAIVAENDELEEVFGTVGFHRQVWIYFGQIFGSGDAVGLDRRHDKDLVVPDNRRGAAAAGKGDLPFDVCVGVPLDR